MVSIESKVVMVRVRCILMMRPVGPPIYNKENTKVIVSYASKVDNSLIEV